MLRAEGIGASQPPPLRGVLSLAVLLLRHRNYRPDGVDITRFEENHQLYAEEYAEIVAAQGLALEILAELGLTLEEAIRRVKVVGDSWNVAGERIQLDVLLRAGRAFENQV